MRKTKQAIKVVTLEQIENALGIRLTADLKKRITETRPDPKTLPFKFKKKSATFLVPVVPCSLSYLIKKRPERIATTRDTRELRSEDLAKKKMAEGWRIVTISTGYDGGDVAKALLRARKDGQIPTVTEIIFFMLVLEEVFDFISQGSTARSEIDLLSSDVSSRGHHMLARWTCMKAGDVHIHIDSDEFGSKDTQRANNVLIAHDVTAVLENKSA